MMPLMNTFSRPEISGWKPAPSSIRADTRPCTATVPVVGFVMPPFSVSPDAFEVESVFEVPLAFVLDVRNHLPRDRAQQQALEQRAPGSGAQSGDEIRITGADAAVDLQRARPGPRWPDSS